MNNKGISPLIATVLIIFFVVTIAGTVIFWATGLLERSTEKAEGELDILEAESEIDYSVDDAVFVSGERTIISRIIQGLVVDDSNLKKVKISLSNNAEFEIRYFIVRVFDVDGKVYVNDNFEVNLEPFGFKEVIFEFDASGLGEIEYFEIMPKINDRAIENKKIKFRARS